MKGLLVRFWPIIALAFPVLEIAGIVFFWGEIGAWTLLWLLATVVFGAALISAERIAFVPGMAATLLSGGNPVQALLASGLRFLAGILFIIPGPVSDVVAVGLLLWAGMRPPPPNLPGGPGRKPGDEVIEGDYRRVD